MEDAPPLTADQPPSAPPPSQPDPPEAAPATTRPRRRGRTTLLIACAAVLGVVAGVCTGYLVQADRDPDPLPPLAAQTMAQAGGAAPQAYAATGDRRTRTDGDLRKLLVRRPAGTQEADSVQGWRDLYGYAKDYREPDYMFRELSTASFRRAAVTAWKKGRSSAKVHLIQFRDAEKLGSRDFLSGQQGYMSESKWAGNDGEPIPGSSKGRVWVFDHPHTEPGYLPLYEARALATRGDIVMDIWLYDTRPIPKKSAMDLAKKQLERL
ncbi:hypothetical protein [Streptomyces sp. NPDC046939]|uniref:hypothetical protein n=1 Tax=Streptomyces sp. NPDC046939 TaxID=3155376 RepID=UPI0033FDA751